VNEPPEPLTSTDEAPNATEPVRARPKDPSDHTDTVNVEADHEREVERLDPVGASTTLHPVIRPTQRPPRTPQVLTAAVLVLIVVSIVIFAIEVATQ
jgi:hypothetical protein